MSVTVIKSYMLYNIQYNTVHLLSKAMMNITQIVSSCDHCQLLHKLPKFAYGAYLPALLFELICFSL